MKKFLIALSIAAAPLTAYEIVEDTSSLPEVVSSDARTYKIRLSNELSAYLISDPRAKKSAAILSVNAGSWQDPDEHPGLAHFLEHMLFMGTKKYPDEAAFFEFVKSHGGKSNAFTEDQYTSYVFDIDTPAFPEALDRFSQFFISPLLKTSGLKREIRAIDQEFEGKTRENFVRRLMIYKNYGHPDHPFRRFNIGNASSLKDAGQKELKDWFEKHYSANKMLLAIHSPLPVDALARLVDENFLPIVNKELSKEKYNAPLFSSALKGKRLYVKPLQSERSLLLLWELPPIFAKSLESKPGDLLCWILGQEGKKSLLEALRDQGLALELQCGTYQWDCEHIAFMLRLELTSKGVGQVDSVVEQVFRTFATIKQEGIPRHIYDDINTIKTLEHQYPEKESPYEEVIKQARNLRFEKFESYPEKTTIIKKFDPSLALELLDKLTPQDMIMDLLADPSLTGVEFEKNERWMDTEYTIKRIPPELQEKWSNAEPHPAVAIPPPNPYIPKNLTLEKLEDKSILESDKGKLALIPSHDYKVPKVSWTILIKTPSVNKGIGRLVVLNELLIRSVKKELSPYSYEAKLAGLDYDIEQKDFSIKITVNGYSENAERLLKDILRTFTQSEISEQRFEDEKKALEQNYRNFDVKSPYLQGLDLIKNVVFKHYTSEPEKLAALQPITYGQFKEYAAHLFDKTYIQAVFFGNVGGESSKKAWEALQQLSEAPYPLSEQPTRKIASLPDDSGPYYLSEKIGAKGNALVLFIQDPDFTFKNYAAQEILSEMISTPFFNELRTTQQTAYIIGNLQQEIEKVLFQIFVLESHSHAPRDLLARVELFMEGFFQTLASSQDVRNQFESIKSALIHKLKTPEESLKKQGKEIADRLLDHDYDFDWLQKRIAGAESLSFEDFIQYSRKTLNKSNKRRLAALMEGIESDNILDYSEAKSVGWLREKLNYIPENVQ